MNNKIFKLIIVLFSIIWYKMSISAIGKNDESKVIKIETGSTATSIAKILKENNLIKNELAFKIYIKIHNSESFKAGKYELNQTMDVARIVSDMQEGNVYKNITITFLEGKNMRWFADKIEEETNNNTKDVYMEPVYTTLYMGGNEYPTVDFEETGNGITFESVNGFIKVNDSSHTIRSNSLIVEYSSRSSSIGGRVVYSDFTPGDTNINIPININGLKSNESYNFKVISDNV